MGSFISSNSHFFRGFKLKTKNKKTHNQKQLPTLDLPFHSRMASEFFLQSGLLYILQKPRNPNGLSQLLHPNENCFTFQNLIIQYG